MKIFLWITTSVAVTVALIVAWLGFNSAQDARAALAEVTTRRAKLDADIASIQTRVATASRDETQLRTALQESHARAEKSPAQKNPSAAPATPPGRPDLAALMEAKPELRTLFKHSFQANLGIRYSLFYQSAKLSPAQIQKFEEAMTDAEQDRMDLQATAKTQGLAATDPAIVKQKQEMDARLTAAQKDALGDTGYEDFQQYRRQEPMMGFLTGVASLVAHTSTPMTTANAQQVLTVLAEASSSYQRGAAVDPMTIDWPKALQRLQPLIPPAQFDSLKANSHGPEVMELIKQYYQQQNTGAK